MPDKSSPASVHTMPSFPSLIGGLVTKEDLVPSIMIAILYGSLIPLALFRYARSSRTTLLNFPFIMSVERLALFSIRAIQSRNEAKAVSPALVSYEQLSLGMGSIAISHALTNFLRVLLVNSTMPESSDGDQSLDQPRRRFWYRRLTDFLNLAYLASLFPGATVGNNYLKLLLAPKIANPSAIIFFRYESCAVALFLTATIGVITLIASWKIPRIPKKAAYILTTICCLLSTVFLYRLVVMYKTTDSLLSRGPGSFSSPMAKGLFYLFHMLPEWLAILTFLGPNNRKIFATGPFGDWRLWDRKKKQETSNQRESVGSVESKGAEQFIA